MYNQASSKSMHSQTRLYSKGSYIWKKIISSSDYFMDSAKNDPKHDMAKDYKPLNNNVFNVS